MKATIKCYKGNATLFYEDNSREIYWDGLEWDNEEEWNEWADYVLSPIANAENYEDIKFDLHIYTQHLIKN